MLHLKNNGFTIIEIIISLFISALIFILLSQVYLLAQNTYLTTDAKAEITQNGRVIVDRMIREIRQTQDIITQLPADSSGQTPSEIMFQDGHNTSTIQYIRYYLDGTNIKRQIIVYYFADQPDDYVHSFDTAGAPPHNPPIQQIVDERIVGEFVSDIEFYGSPLLYINLYLAKDGRSSVVSTSVYGRNL